MTKFLPTSTRGILRPSQRAPPLPRTDITTAIAKCISSITKALNDEERERKREGLTAKPIWRPHNARPDKVTSGDPADRACAPLAVEVEWMNTGLVFRRHCLIIRRVDVYRRKVAVQYPVEGKVPARFRLQQPNPRLIVMESSIRPAFQFRFTDFA
ncbi:hypothetical protein N7530_000343 [Penicillium desertorum]|uniref:Uncharacterized protein n=1 Tax=Penicillium desertorum TaxID=1303715 RepID=A0A9X0BVA0_9EURO|nr:hypothetical protein N7530_000343 [Penicillium desertorum]